MNSELPVECLREIIEILQDDMKSLHSCLFVNKLWCHIAVEILWKDTWKFCRHYCKNNKESSILSTLISCFSNDSKNYLISSGIIIKKPTNRSPLFDYARYCRNLPSYHINYMDMKKLLKQEIYKMFISKCSTFKYLHLRESDILIPWFPGANTSLSNLVELRCEAQLKSEIFSELSKFCKSLQKIIIDHCNNDNEGLANLIENQSNLKFVECSNWDRFDSNEKCFKISKAIIKKKDSIFEFGYGGGELCLLLNTISQLSNLETLKFWLNRDSINDIIQELEFAHFKNLKIIYLETEPLPLEILSNLILNTNYSLRKIYLNYWYVPDPENINNFNQVISKFCPSLEFLTTWCFINNTNTAADGDDGRSLNEEENSHDSNNISSSLKNFKQIFQNCKNLKSILIRGVNEPKIDGDLLFDLLFSTRPKSLNRIKLDGEWKFSINKLCKFLEYCQLSNIKLWLDVCKMSNDERDFTFEHLKAIQYYNKQGIIKNEEFFLNF
ncbi:8377_t:CDS:2 [Entrophospora sp. SA101]|nr:1058_t:CDS:2 [Entrophospora sp. SA101]CAJ0763867.1 8377_t:CDS:2 [Entrophospora sp. SA101]CAJ0866960.1 5497_t:CDS:2 [Entrophospora sp. SA101]